MDLSRDELLDLVVELAEALDAAHVELVQLADTDIPVPTPIDDLADEHALMKATLGHADIREKAKAIYRETREKGADRPELDLGKIPVEQDVPAQAAAAWESLRRAALVDATIGDALDGALLRSSFAGC